MDYGWMIYPKSAIHNRYGNNAFEWMQSAARRHHIRLDIVFEDDLMIRCGDESAIFSGREKMAKPEFVVMRCYNWIVGSQLESMGIRVINRTAAMFRSCNKVITSQLLSREGIPTPETLFAARFDYDFVNRHFGYKPFIMKQVEGSLGRNVFLIRNEEAFRAAFERTGGYALCQEYVESSFGRDLRVYVLGEKVLGCVMRTSERGFRANFSLGGHAEAFEPTDEVERLSICSAKALGLEFCGIDLLFGADGFTICEVNGNAGFRTIWNTSHVDIAEALFRYIDEAVYGRQEA